MLPIACLVTHLRYPLSQREHLHQNPIHVQHTRNESNDEEFCTASQTLGFCWRVGVVDNNAKSSLLFPNK